VAPQPDPDVRGSATAVAVVVLVVEGGWGEPCGLEDEDDEKYAKTGVEAVTRMAGHARGERVFDSRKGGGL